LPATPWKSLQAPEPQREYLVLLTYLPLKRFLSMRRFGRDAGQIEAQLEATPGLLGYSLRAKPLRRRFWTLSAWTDERALREFVRTEPHGRVMTELPPHMGPTKFFRWTAPGSALPPSWDDALRREQEEPRR